MKTVIVVILCAVFGFFFLRIAYRLTALSLAVLLVSKKINISYKEIWDAFLRRNLFKELGGDFTRAQYIWWRDNKNNKRVLDVDQVIEDMERISKKIETMGEGTDVDRLAQLVMQSIYVLQHRLNRPESLKFIYLDNKEAGELLPSRVVEIARAVYNKEMTQEDAGRQLQELVDTLARAFQQLGITPQTFNAIFMKD